MLRLPDPESIWEQAWLVWQSDGYFIALAYRKHRLDELLASEKNIDALKDFWIDLKSEINPSEGNEWVNSQQHLYCELKNHTENAAFLICMNAGYCREWVFGIRQDFVTERNIDKSAQLLNNLWEAVARFEAKFGGIEIHANSSEAAELLFDLKQIKQQLAALANAVTGGGASQTDDSKTASGRSDFKQSFKDRFITKTEFEVTLGIVEKTAS